jgi:hypothetical protein
MSIQLPLPAGWARNFQSNRDPAERLSSLRQDVLDAKAEIRAALERLAAKHLIPMREVDRSMDWADDGLGDLVYDVENELEHEIEDQDPA